MMCKKGIAILVSLVMAVLFTAGSGLALDKDKVYVNGIDAAFPPYAFIDKDGKAAGFDVEAVNWIAKEMGFKVKHNPIEWDSIIPALLAKKIDFIASGMTASAERNLLVDFTIPYVTVTQVLMVKAGDATTMKELLTTGKKLGVQRGTITNGLLKDLAKWPQYDFAIVEYDNTDLSMEDVKLGRIHASGMDSTIAQEMMKKGDFVVAGTFDVNPEVYGYAVREEDNELLKTLNEGLTKLMADPYWGELKAKWEIN